MSDRRKKKRRTPRVPPYRDEGTRLASEITPKKVKFLWRKFLPVGKLALFEGDPDEGKSYLLLKVAACLSKGERLPLSRKRVGPCKILILMPEDDADDTMVPRLIACRADLDQIIFVDDVIRFDDDGLARLEEHIRYHKPRFVIIDPLTAFLAGLKDTGKTYDVRVPLGELRDIAERTRVSVAIIRHFRKAGGGAKERGAGPIDILGQVRSAARVIPNKDEPGERILQHFKANAVRFKAPPLRYTIDEDGDLKFLGESDLSNEEIDAMLDERKPRGRPNTKSQECREMLNILLADGPVAQFKVRQAAKARKISMRTVERVKSEIGIESYQKGKAWFWDFSDRQKPVRSPKRKRKK